MATRTATYGYGTSAPRMPAATAPLSNYGGTPYTAQKLPKWPSYGPLPNAANNPANPTYGQPTPRPPTNPVTPAGGPPPAPAPPPTASPVYDITTDPALQQIEAITSRSDSEARAQALKQETQQVLGYGDPTLAASVLGPNDPNVQAAAQNPTSTLAQLRMARERNLAALTEDLNKQNLFYSGWRVNQEGQAGQDYQNQLASAAGNVQGNLDTIEGNLSSALANNEALRIQAMNDARNRNPSGTVPPTTPPDTTPTAQGAGTPTPTVSGQPGVDLSVVDPNTIRIARALGLAVAQ